MSEPRPSPAPIVSPRRPAYINHAAAVADDGADDQAAKELLMVEVLERDTVGETIEATVNYILDNGEKIFTQTAVPGETDVRSGGAVHPRRGTHPKSPLQKEPFVFAPDRF